MLLDEAAEAQVLLRHADAPVEDVEEHVRLADRAKGEREHAAREGVRARLFRVDPGRVDDVEPQVAEPRCALLPVSRGPRRLVRGLWEGAVMRGPCC